MSLFILAVLSTQSVSVMAIMEGYFHSWCIFWSSPCPAFLGRLDASRKSLQRTNSKTMLALSGAFIFILSSLKIPSVGDPVRELTGVGLGTAMFGPSVISVFLGYLLFQAPPSWLTAADSIWVPRILNGSGWSIVGYFVYKFVKSIKPSTPVFIFYLCGDCGLGDLCDTSSVWYSPMRFCCLCIEIHGCLRPPNSRLIAIVEGFVGVVLYNLISENIKERAGLFNENM